MTHERALLAFVCSTAVAMAQTNPDVVAVQLGKTVEITGVLTTDVDGDGRSDLVLACYDHETKRRLLRTHRRAAETPAFASEPSAPPYQLERDVIAFTFADIDERPGRELVLFTAERTVAVLPGANGAFTYEPLFAHRLVWPAPDPERVLALDDVVHDVDGDGRDDFLLPEADGARVMLQRRSDGKTTFQAPMLWTVPAWRSPLTAGSAGSSARVGGGELQLHLDLGDRANDDGIDGRPLVHVKARTPRFVLLDLAGVGARDGLALRNDTLWWWQHRPGTGFAAAATALPLPMPEDRLVLFDPTFDVQLADIDGDGSTDLLLTTSARRNDEIEVRIDLFVQRATGSPWAGKPDGRLRLQTLAMPPQLVDADGDGRLDLVAITVRTDLLRGLTGGAPAALEAQLNVFRGSGKRFEVPAMLNQQVQLSAPTERASNPFVRVVAGAAGTAGSLLLRSEDRIALQPLERDGTSLRLLPPVWQVPIAVTARPRVVAGTTNEVLVVDTHELLHVRWR